MNLLSFSCFVGSKADSWQSFTYLLGLTSSPMRFAWGALFRLLGCACVSMKPGFMWVTEGVKAVDTRSALRCYPQSGVNMLTDVQSKKAQPSTSHYKLPDERGLHLLVKTNGSKLWQLRYRYQGKEKTASLGQSQMSALLRRVKSVKHSESS